jgi:hypothetical protein
MGTTDVQTHTQAETRTPAEQVERRRKTLDAAEVTARLIRLVVGVIAAVVGLEIVLTLLSANAANSIVHRVALWAHSLAGPFVGMFTLHSPKWTLTLDYGIAIIVYLGVAELLIMLIRTLIVPTRRRLGVDTGAPVVR